MQLLINKLKYIMNLFINCHVIYKNYFFDNFETF